MILIRPPMTNFRMTVRSDCAVFARSPLPPSMKVLARWLPVWGARSLDRSLHRLIAGLWNKANLPFHQPGLFIGFWTGNSWTPLLLTGFWCPTWGCTLATSGSRDLPKKSHWPWWCAGMVVMILLSVLLWPREGDLGDIPSSCHNHLFWGSSLFLPCRAVAANVCFSLVEWKHASGQADKLQDWVSPWMCTRGNLSSEHEVLLGIFASWFWCLTLRTVCGHWVSLGHFVGASVVSSWTPLLVTLWVSSSLKISSSLFVSPYFFLHLAKQIS